MHDQVSMNGIETVRIKTERLSLIAMNAELARLQVDDPDAFFQTLGAQHEFAWPPMEFKDTQTSAFSGVQSEPAGWRGWVCMMALGPSSPRRAVGMGGFMGPPDGAGTVNLIYAFLPSFREQGLATEAVMGLIGWAFAHDSVKRIRAFTAPHLTAPIRVLEKTGFVAVGTVSGGAAGEKLVCYERVRSAEEAA